MYAILIEINDPDVDSETMQDVEWRLIAAMNEEIGKHYYTIAIMQEV